MTYRRLDAAILADAELILSAITHPAIYRHVVDDLGPKREDFAVMPSPDVWYMGAFEHDLFMGVFAFFPQNSVCWEVHTCLLPHAWGSSVAIARDMAAWVFSNTPCMRIITSVPDLNRLALRLAESVGFKRYGVNERSWLKDKQLRDQIVLGLSKPIEGYTCQ